MWIKFDYIDIFVCVYMRIYKFFHHKIFILYQLSFIWEWTKCFIYIWITCLNQVIAILELTCYYRRNVHDLFFVAAFTDHFFTQLVSACRYFFVITIVTHVLLDAQMEVSCSSCFRNCSYAADKWYMTICGLDKRLTMSFTYPSNPKPSFTVSTPLR